MMLLTCTACSAKLSIPDSKVPKSGNFTVACPKCQQKIPVAVKRTEPEPMPEPVAVLSAPAPSTVAAQSEGALSRVRTSSAA